MATNYPYKNLVLEGSGIRAFAYAGAMQELEKAGILNNIKNIAGTSGGAIISTLWCIGFTPQEMIDMADDVPADAFNDSRWKPWLGFSKLKNKFGYHTGIEFSKWFSKQVECKTGDANITFEELYERNQKKIGLYIVATDVLHQKIIVLSHENFPKMKITDAVRASIAIPLYFTPLPINKEGKILANANDEDVVAVLNDGGMLANYPITVFDSVRFYKEDSISQKYIYNPYTLGLNLEASRFINQDVHINSFTDYFKMVYHTMIDKPVPEEEKQRTIIIDDLELSPKVKKLDSKTVKALIDSGIKGAQEFLGGS